MNRFLPDRFSVALLATVVLANVLPARGHGTAVVGAATTLAVGLLFFLHGAKLSREAIVEGITHWRLHLLIFGCTFVLFPLVGLVLKPVLMPLVTPALYSGVLFLCVLPSTVQSAIAFTALARGNVPAAVCSASASTLLGVFVTPFLASLLLASHSGVAVSLDSLLRILMQLVAPFVAGHLLRPWIGAWLRTHGKGLALVDRGSILLVVYSAFGTAVTEGLWSQVSVATLIALLVVCAVILGVCLVVTTQLSRRLGFDKADEITVVFCGSKKSLASGVPMANVLFASTAVGTAVLPLMMFHQLQLMVVAILAQRYARRDEEADLASSAAALPRRSSKRR